MAAIQAKFCKSEDILRTAKPIGNEEFSTGKSAIAARLAQFSQGKAHSREFARLGSGWLSQK